MVGKFINTILQGASSFYSTDPNNVAYRINKELKNRIYPNVAPQYVGSFGASFENDPYVVYTVEKNNPTKIKGYNRSPRNNFEITIQVVSSNYSTVTRISSLIIDLFSRYKNTINTVNDETYGVGIKSSSTEGSALWGAFCPPSTGVLEYFGGLQIIALNFENVLETYNEKLFNYNNVINFSLATKDDFTTWGADLSLNINDLNLMASNQVTDPLYSQPISYDQGINFLYSPAPTAETNNVESTFTNGNYDIWYDNSGTIDNPSNTNRPTIKKSAIDYPYTAGTNYIEFGDSKFLQAVNTSNRKSRRYKEGTAFFVLDIPDSILNSKEVGLVFGDSSTKCGLIYAGVQSLAGGFLLKFNFGGIGVQANGDDRGLNFTVGNIISWPAVGINPDMNLLKPFFFAVSFRRNEDDPTKVEGRFDLVTSSGFSGEGGDNNEYYGYYDTAYTGEEWEEYFFDFSTIHTDRSSYMPSAGGWLDPINPQAAMNLYDMVIWPDYLEFGSNKYLKIKKEIIGKYGWYGKTS